MFAFNVGSNCSLANCGLASVDLRRLTWMDTWNEFNGFATIEPFDPAKGAAWYCAKYLMKANGDWELGGDLEAFRISQPLLPMKGLRVQTDTRITGSSSRQLAKSEAAANRAKKQRENRVAKRSQEELADFKEPGTSEDEPNPIRAHFEKETRRKPR
jgi:hypothetical protein